MVNFAKLNRDKNEVYEEEEKAESSLRKRKPWLGSQAMGRNVEIK